MHVARVVQCVDTHSCGEATRVVIGGLPVVEGQTMAEKYAYFRSKLDNLRTALLCEPRGFDNMLGAFLVPATNSGADFGAIYASATQYFEMCGDSTFSVAKTLIELGMVAVAEPRTRIRLDTYGGVVEVEVAVKDGAVGDITYQSVPAFLSESASVLVPGLGKVDVDVAFGGLWYGFVRAADVGIAIGPAHRKKALALGMDILRAVQEQVSVKHPSDDLPGRVSLITFYESGLEQGADFVAVNVYGDNATCRSPAGTMSAARAAASHALGELRTGAEIVIRNGWTGSEHRVRVTGETTLGNVPAIMPQLTATAYVTGTYQAIIERDDPFGEGFLL